jgi:hypothetical protein
LVVVILPALARSGWQRRRAGCAVNLSRATTGMLLYAQDNHGAFPSRGFGPRTRRFDVVGHRAWRRVWLDHNNSRNLFLAVRLKYVTPESLICPETEDRPAPLGVGDTRYYDFNVGNGWEYVSLFSYSYHLQFRRRDPDTPGYPLTSRSHPLMPLLADRTPLLTYASGKMWGSGCVSDGCGVPVGVAADRANSRNHRQTGQNVARVAGNVEWADAPTAGVDGDNIYTVWDGPDRAAGAIHLNSMPRGPTDSFLVP